MHDHGLRRPTVPLFRSALAKRRGALRARPFRGATAATLAVVALGAPSAIAAAPLDGSTQSNPQEPLKLAENFETLDRRGVRPSEEDFDRLAAAATAAGEVQVIVGLQTRFTPEGALSENDHQRQQSDVAAEAARLVNTLAGSDHEVVRTYDALPYVTLRLSGDAIAKLEASGRAASLQTDEPEAPLLDDTARMVEAREAATLGRTGAGRQIAVLDTGVDKDHAFIGSASASQEACFSAGNGDEAQGRGDCPNGAETQVGAGAGEDCTYHDKCAHGTHVAGIAIGGSAASRAFTGVARDAGVIPVQVFSNLGGEPRSYPSDQLAGLNYILGRPAAIRDSIAAVNMSLGGGEHASACDTDARKTAIDALASVGIATVIASGNNGFDGRVSAPGCISTAVTVGATTDGDARWVLSNHSDLVDLMAPGVAVRSAVPNATDSSPPLPHPMEDKDGTSMAAPHVAGAFAVLDQLNPAASVATHLSALSWSGVPVTAAGVTKPRIRVLAASVLHASTGFRDARTFSGTGTDMVSNGVGLATRAGGPAAGHIALTGIPAGSTIHARYLYYQTIGGPDPDVLFRGVPRTGSLVGASENTCWLPTVTPNRTYQVVLPASAVPGNGNYAVSGVGDAAGADGQGASLVVVFSTPGGRPGRVHLRHGAMTVNWPLESMSHDFTGLSIPTPATAAHLNVGLGDGEARSESPMQFAGSNVTAPNLFSGSDGALWDDHTIRISPALLPVGTTSRTNRLSTADDCLAWAYAGLTITR